VLIRLLLCFLSYVFIYLFIILGILINIFLLLHFQVATWSSHNAKIKSLLLFGDHILSLDAQGNLFLWEFKGIKDNLVPFAHPRHIKLDPNFIPTCILHPDTYLNKVSIIYLSFSIHRFRLYCL
jgi:U3 small nucleolar RNA-associated protein 21